MCATARASVRWKGIEAGSADLVFTSDGSRLISASADQTIRLWDWSTRKPSGILRGHLDGVDGVALSPDGRTLASHCKDGSIYLLGRGQALASPRLSGPSSSAHLRPRQRTVFTPDSQSILGVERGGGGGPVGCSTLKETRRLWGDSTNQSDIALSPDARRVVRAGPEGRLHVWDVRSGLESTNFIVDTWNADGFAFTRGREAICYFQRTETNEWHLRYGKVTHGGGKVRSRSNGRASKHQARQCSLAAELARDGGQTGLLIL